MDPKSELEQIGVDATSAAALAALVAQPPEGMLDADEPIAVRRPELILQISILAARDLRRFADAMPKMTDWLEAQLSELQTYDVARYWHLRGVRAWRLDDSVFFATRSLNTSARLLAAEGTSRASAYSARVHDTLGQLLHQQGMLADARHELGRALELRDLARDRTGAAITLGNLGRLCLDLGDYKAAAEYLARDLAIVDETSPSLVGLRAQLLSHLATCHLKLDAVEVAAELLARSATLARAAGDPVAEVFAAIGRGNVSLARADAPSALATAHEVQARLEDTGFPSRARPALLAEATKLAADSQLASHAYDLAIAAYKRVLELLAPVSDASPMQYAETFRGLSRALAAKHHNAESARSLRLALRHLDGTAAEALRLEIERDLQSASNESWLLHAAGRFIGHEQIELLLNEGGELGFRGKTRRVVVLFSDIRGFTTLSERLQPDELIGFLNDFLSYMTRCIEHHGGMVDKFIGDAVMAIFPMDDGGGSRAIEAGLAMRDELDRFNRRRGDSADLSIGIGLHGGDVVAGLIGSPQKRAYTVIGDVVNTASRLEGMTKQLGAMTLVTNAVLTAADRERFIVRPLGSYAPKGRKHALSVFDVFGQRDQSPASRAMLAEIARVEAALAMFGDRQFEAAAARFAELERDAAGTSRINGYTLLAAKSRELDKAPPGADWHGEIALSDK